MALIDEYKQAIQDVLDGRMKEAPRPSELPWTEDKAATMWAAAAAELIAEANGGDALPDTPGSDGTYALQNTVSSGTGTLSWASGGSSGGALYVHRGAGDALDATWQDIKDAFDGGRLIILKGATLEYLAQISYDDSGYYVTFFTQLGYSAFTAETANSYPVLQV